MRKVEISDAVWNEIAKRGSFGETVDDVLRRTFKISNKSPSTSSSVTSVQQNNSIRPPRALRKMSARVTDSGILEIQFKGEDKKYYQLPEKHDKDEIRTILLNAVSYADDQRASLGQINAIRKALTSAGYHLTK